MDDLWQPLFQHAFESDVVLLGEGDTVGLHTNGAALVAFAPELQVHIDKATAADIEKSAVAVADKADVVSASTGAASVAPAGVASVSAGVTSAAAGQVAETSDAIAIAREEGLAIVPLPGSRRAIKLFLRLAHESLLNAGGANNFDCDETMFDFLFDSESLHCEFLELCVRVGDHAQALTAGGGITRALSASLEATTTRLDDGIDSEAALRMFCCLSKRFSKRSDPPADIAGYKSVVVRLAEESIDKSSLNHLLAPSKLASLDISQLVTLVDVLPPDASADGLLLVGDVIFSDFSRISGSNPSYSTWQHKVSLSPAGTTGAGKSIILFLNVTPRSGAERKPGANELKKCDEFDISLSVDGECASDHPLTVYDVQLKARGTEKPSPKVESMRASFMSECLSIDLRTELFQPPEPRPINVALADGTDPDTGSPSHVAGSIVSGVLNYLIDRVVATGKKEEDSPTAPSVRMSQEPVAPPPQPAPAPPAAAIHQLRVASEKALADAATEADAADKETDAAPQDSVTRLGRALNGGDDSGSARAELSSLCTVRIELRCVKDERRLALLRAWASAHGLDKEAPSMVDLVMYYDALCERESPEANASDPMRPASADPLRRILFDDTLARPLADSRSLRRFFEEGATRLGAPAVRRLLAARPTRTTVPSASRPTSPSPETSEASGPSPPCATEQLSAEQAAAPVRTPSSSSADQRRALAQPTSPGADADVDGDASAEEALLDALRPWAAAHTPDEMVAAHVRQPDGLFGDAARAGSPLRAALSDGLLPGIEALRGKSYERKAIEAYWTREKAAVSPVTRKPLQSKTLVPNINLRVLCEEYSARQRRLHGGATSPQDVVMGALLPPPHAPGAKRRRPAELEHDEQAASGVAAGAKRKLRLASGDGSPPPV
ncbi:hypothetical protein EMIHUDRAFT_229621 [Emiliania huxleyi CCMP1516]|uniref:U-box domain-containing protein n=2 Tax=Emiliania huxleyi TaxID=2903 RepID=A0A0D3KCK5_EMIH1|nr:hypothetical protein EMIHUDRAFT_229621 [Emiliania huxleyi CCMP1516]EOD33490.1 hypothetical protein EMIHUDRAFT_229621 [Emiliania huxleyi CCMP1516]|eukprot:XP_005785919.1 hypothetical protein EMIHUDRAFT_229621 [Emiliania huxleyi CCMP1516]